MLKRYQLSLFIFRRDLRLPDNTGLLEALHDSERVVVCFIFDDQQVCRHDYFSERAFTFMLQSLEELRRQVVQHGGQLYFFQGKPAAIVERLLTELPIEAVYLNRDYTPFSLQRDSALEYTAQQYQRDFYAFDDVLLHEPGSVMKKDGTPYTVYTPFMKCARDIPVLPIQRNAHKNYYAADIAFSNPQLLDQYLTHYSQPLIISGGRQQAQKQLRVIDGLADYETVRDLPAKNATTHLSAHNKFGTISIREVYEYIKKKQSMAHMLIRELYWRDFFTHIAYFFPRVFQGAFHEQYKAIKWTNNSAHFAAWCEGKTGFPIVDAGMRELNATGYMHNRVRMITASFLVKDLHIDWRWGERYFAQQLIDYDPAVNNGNWQWAASTGCDAQPYFRIFNPTLQQKKYDPDGLYLKKWLPEFFEADGSYPEPLVDHKVASLQAKALFKQI